MRVLVWIMEGSWEGCISAARAACPENAEVTLLHVSSADVSALSGGAFAGLLGRGRGGERDPARHVELLSEQAAQQLLADAQALFNRPAKLLSRTGRIEREVVAAAEGMDLLVLARDGDRSRLGPRSLGRDSRFVVDHAPCTVVLAWPDQVPSVASIPPPPPAGHEHPPHKEHPPPPEPHDAPSPPKRPGPPPAAGPPSRRKPRP